MALKDDRLSELSELSKFPSKFNSVPLEIPATLCEDLGTCGHVHRFNPIEFGKARLASHWTSATAVIGIKSMFKWKAVWVIGARASAPVLPPTSLPAISTAVALSEPRGMSDLHWVCLPLYSHLMHINLPPGISFCLSNTHIFLNVSILHDNILYLQFFKSIQKTCLR